MELKAKIYSACVDCYLLEATGCSSSLHFHYGDDFDSRLAEIKTGYKALLGNTAGWLSAGVDLAEFSAQPCECCGSKLAGSRHELIVFTRIDDQLQETKP